MPSDNGYTRPGLGHLWVLPLVYAAEPGVWLSRSEATDG